MPEPINLAPVIVVGSNPQTGKKGGTITIDPQSGTVHASRSLSYGRIRDALMEQGYILGENITTRQDTDKVFRVTQVPVQEVDFSNEPEVITARTASEQVCEGVGTYNPADDACELPAIVIRGTVR